MRTFEATSAAPGPDGNLEAVRVFAAEIRETQVVGKPYRFLEGLAVPYEKDADIGWFVESHAAGSFERSTKGAAKQAPLLLFHDNRSFPIGHAESWNHDGGMRGVWRLNDTADAQQAAALADNGDLGGLSIGFQPIRSDWKLVDDWDPTLGADHKDRVTRLESRLIEVSITPTPAFAEATISAVRSASYTREARTALLGPLDADVWRLELEKLRG